MWGTVQKRKGGARRTRRAAASSAVWCAPLNCSAGRDPLAARLSVPVQLHPPDPLHSPPLCLLSLHPHWRQCQPCQQGRRAGCRCGRAARASRAPPREDAVRGAARATPRRPTRADRPRRHHRPPPAVAVAVRRRRCASSRAGRALDGAASSASATHSALPVLPLALRAALCVCGLPAPPQLQRCLLNGPIGDGETPTMGHSLLLKSPEYV